MAIAGNPNHPVSRGLEEQWHKLLALVLYKHRHDLPAVVITSADVEEFMASGHTNIVAHDKKDGLHLVLADDTSAAAMARKAGGLPT